MRRVRAGVRVAASGVAFAAVFAGGLPAAAAAQVVEPLPGPRAVPDSTRVSPSDEGDRRFEIVSVGDSTVTLLVPGQRWIRPGQDGIAVDPRRRDALVARLRVLARSADTAEVLVTGQTTRMSTEYVAIFRRPMTPTVRQRAFWNGLLAGLLVGAGAVFALVRGR